MIRLPKGTQDYAGEQYEKLEYLKSVITEIFGRFQGEMIETPVFELSDLLTNKYGDDEKLIYDLKSSTDYAKKQKNGAERYAS